MRYLGVPIFPKKWGKLECNGVVHKITERVSCWITTHLSYWATIFIIPVSVLVEVDKICPEFLWGSTQDRAGIPIVAWSTICKEKSG